MKERLTNNMGLKLLSLFLAFFLWLLVVNVSNPEVERSREVQVEIVNEGTLTAAGQTYEIVGKNTVTVSYRVRTLDEALEMIEAGAERIGTSAGVAIVEELKARLAGK